MPPGELELLDWKRRVFALYAEVRSAADPEAAWQRWRAARDDLFRTHPQSPLPAESRTSLRRGPVLPLRPGSAGARHGRAGRSDGDPGRVERRGAIEFRRFALARFRLGGAERELELYWLAGYGGGLFLPFRDETSGRETYGGGRYLFDTVKGADLGTDGERLVLDFNFAYNPSCSYDPRWVCPLSRPRTGCSVAISAGERMPGG